MRATFWPLAILCGAILASNHSLRCPGHSSTMALAAPQDHARQRRQTTKRTVNAQTSNIQQARRQAKEIRQKLTEARARVKHLKRQENVHVERLSDLQQQIEHTTIQLEDSKWRLHSARQRLYDTKLELEENKAKFEKQLRLASLRLRAIYKTKNASHWEALLTAPDLVGFLTRYQYLVHISRHDERLLQELDDLIHNINRQKYRYDLLVNTTLNMTESIAAQKRDQLEKTREEADLVERIRTERAAWEAAEEQLERSSREIESMIRRFTARRIRRPSLGTGQFIWPVGGRITSRFGMRLHPIYRVLKPHHGIDFGASFGSPVVAADGGMVIFSGWYDGYGKIVVIDHGADLVTLYGHLSSVVISVGEQIGRGQAVGRVGSTGLSTGPHLHFEVRRNGSPVNPLGFLR